MDFLFIYLCVCWCFVGVFKSKTPSISNHLQGVGETGACPTFQQIQGPTQRLTTKNE